MSVFLAADILTRVNNKPIIVLGNRCSYTFAMTLQVPSTEIERPMGQWVYTEPIQTLNQVNC